MSTKEHWYKLYTRLVITHLKVIWVDFFCVMISLLTTRWFLVLVIRQIARWCQWRCVFTKGADLPLCLWTTGRPCTGARIRIVSLCRVVLSCDTHKRAGAWPAEWKGFTFQCMFSHLEFFIWKEKRISVYKKRGMQQQQLFLSLLSLLNKISDDALLASFSRSFCFVPPRFFQLDASVNRQRQQL